MGFRAACPAVSLLGLGFFVATAQSRTMKSQGQAEISVLLPLHFFLYFFLYYLLYFVLYY
jgi:hypothetical protein